MAGPDPGGSGGGDLPTLTVAVRIDPADAVLATALGWAEGVPEAQVHLNRSGGPATFDVRTADVSGMVEFERLPPGRYRVFASRRLTQEEAAASGEPVRAFGDGQTFDLSGDTSIDLRLVSDRPGGLVISEIGAVVPPPWVTGVGGYRDGVFLEVYNNSDEVRYLDGLIFGIAYDFYQDYTHTSCAMSQIARVDASGIYTRRAIRFPGSGTDFPIPPGQVRVVAQSAIDHRPVHPLFLDLRGADFEIGSEQSNPDNPAVPNMLDIGLSAWTGSILFPTGALYYLAESPDLADLPIELRDSQGRGYVKILATSILEAAGFYALWPDQDLESPPCIPFAADQFERYEGGLFEIGAGVESPTESLQRVILRMENGRRILQNSNTSAVDFAFALQSPGVIP